MFLCYLDKIKYKLYWYNKYSAQEKKRHEKQANWCTCHMIVDLNNVSSWISRICEHYHSIQR